MRKIHHVLSHVVIFLSLLTASSFSFAVNYKDEPISYKDEKIKKTTPITVPIPSVIALKEGPYVGVGVGYDSYKIHQTTSLTASGITNTYNPTLNATGLVGNFFGGYGHYFNNVLYLGGEIFINTSAVNQNNSYSTIDGSTGINYDSRFSVNTGYGVGFLPGIKLNDDALFFVRLGYQITRLRGVENTALNGTTIEISNTASWNGGFAYGLGFEEAIVEQFSLRGEYIHTNYQSFTATFSTQYAASNNQFMLSLIYHI